MSKAEFKDVFMLWFSELPLRQQNKLINMLSYEQFEEFKIIMGIK